MLKIRLSRGGTKKDLSIKLLLQIVVVQETEDLLKKLVFLIHFYQKIKKKELDLKQKELKYWLGQGAQPTTRVARILGENELIPMPVNGNNPQ